MTLGLISGLDSEVSGVAEGARIVLGPLATLRAMKDGDLVREAK